MNVVNGIEWRIRFPKTLREGIAVAIEQSACAFRVKGLRENLHQRVGPGADDGGDRAFQLGTIRMGRLAPPPADDVVHADQRSFRKKWIERADMTAVCLGQVFA